MKKILLVMLTSMLVSIITVTVASFADTTFPVVIPAVPAQSVTLKATITEVSCMYLPPVFTTSVYRVLFNVSKPNGSLLRTDAISVTQDQLVAMAGPGTLTGISQLGLLINSNLTAYIKMMSTNAVWLSGGRVDSSSQMKVMRPLKR